MHSVRFLIVGFLVSLSGIASPRSLAFTDVGEVTQYQEAIEYLTDQGIVDGYADGSFQPDRILNRAELLKILIEAKGEKDLDEEKYRNCFSDVGEQWFAVYVCHAKEIGIVGGYSDGSFRPEQQVNFVEAAKMMVGVFELETADEGEVWYELYVKALTENKKVPRSIVAFDQDLRRGEMAEMVWRVTEQKEDEAFRSFGEFGERKESIDLGGGYKTNTEHIIIYNNTILDPPPDHDSFTVLKSGIAKDKNFVFLGSKAAERFDAQSFVLLDEKFLKDKNSVYVFHFDGENGILTLEQSDPDSFEVIESGLFAKDKSNVYFRKLIVPEADGDSFEFTQKTNCFGYEYRLYAKDAHNLYIGLLADTGSKIRVISDMNLENLEIFDCGFFKDNSVVFSDEKMIPQADAASFEFLKYGYSKDKDSVFYLSEYVEGADPDSFEVLDFILKNTGAVVPDVVYAKDKDFVFYNTEKIEKGDPGSFRILPHYYSLDKENVYFKDTFIPDADPDTFLVFDQESYEIYAKDKNHVYFSGEKVEGMDAQTFEMITQKHWRNKNK